MDTAEFLRLRGLELELRARVWRNEGDPAFAAWLIRCHGGLDEHHLACAFAIAGALNMKGVRDVARVYSQDPRLLVRVAALGLLDVHEQNGWRD